MKSNNIGKKIRFLSIPEIVIIAVCLAFLALCWVSTTVSDIYVRYCFPYLTGILGRLTSLLSFSIGEKMLVFVVVYLFFLLIFSVIRIIYLLSGKKRKDDSSYEKSVRFVYRFTGILLTIPTWTSEAARSTNTASRSRTRVCRPACRRIRSCSAQ